jgi:hypothetical protein
MSAFGGAVLSVVHLGLCKFKKRSLGYSCFVLKLDFN